MNPEKLLGKHPQSPDIFAIWFECEDKDCGEDNNRRLLKEVMEKRTDAINWLGEKLLNHHVSEKRIKFYQNKLEILGKHGFEKYIEKKKILPTVDKTKKGNAIEVLLIEYIKSSTKKSDLLTIYKLRYNPNVEQAIKGDDTLLFDLRDVKKTKIYLGESKFRAKSDKQAIVDILKSLNEQKLPLSLEYISEMLWSQGRDDLAEIIEDLDIELIKNKNNLIYIGLLVSDEKTEDKVQDYFESSNPTVVFISLGTQNPQEIIDGSFEIAKSTLMTSKNEN